MRVVTLVREKYYKTDEELKKMKRPMYGGTDALRPLSMR